MKKIVAMTLMMLLALPMLAGCKMEKPVLTNPSVATWEGLNSSAGDSGSSNYTDPFSPGTSQRPVGPNVDVGESYETGEPYSPWGQDVEITLDRGNGTKASVTGKLPDLTISDTLEGNVWFGNCKNYGCTTIVSIAKAATAKDSLEQFFDNHITELSRAYTTLKVTHKEVSFELMDSRPAKNVDRQMYRVIGTVNYSMAKETGKYSFCGYVTRLSTGEYLFWMSLCTDGEWANTQRIAENFAKTFKEAVS